MANPLAQLCIKYVELSRGFGESDLSYGVLIFFLLPSFVRRGDFCRKNHCAGRKSTLVFNVIPLPEHKFPLPKQRRVHKGSIVCCLLQQMASLVIELSSPNHLAGTAAGALLNIDPESPQKELTRICVCVRSKSG